MRYLLLHPGFADGPSGGTPGGAARDGRGGRGPVRLNLLLTTAGWREDAWVNAVPQVLGPHGVTVYQARSGMEATQLIQRHEMHIAVVDLSLPLDSTTLGSEPGGARVMQLLRRLEQPPAMVMVRPPQPTRRENSRSLTDALMDGVFAVVDRPYHPETMLRVLHRIIERHYPNCWPDCGPDPWSGRQPGGWRS